MLAFGVSHNRALQISRVILRRCSLNGRPLSSETGEQTLHSHCSGPLGYRPVLVSKAILRRCSLNDRPLGGEAGGDT